MYNVRRSMFELMRFYVFRSGWRGRLGWNAAATYIWVCWVASFGCVLAAIAAALLHRDLRSALVMLVASATMFALSFLFLPAARRSYEVDKIIHRNE